MNEVNMEKETISYGALLSISRYFRTNSEKRVLRREEVVK